MLCSVPSLVELPGAVASQDGAVAATKHVALPERSSPDGEAYATHELSKRLWSLEINRRLEIRARNLI